MRRRDVERLTGLGRSALYEAISRKRFPKQVKLTDKAVGWVEDEVLAWIAHRVSERDRTR